MKSTNEVKKLTDGYITDGCPICPYWSDGTGELRLGCNVPFHIMDCADFREKYEAKQEDKNDEDIY